MRIPTLAALTLPVLLGAWLATAPTRAHGQSAAGQPAEVGAPASDPVTSPSATSATTAANGDALATPPAPALDAQQLRGWSSERYATSPRPRRKIALMIVGLSLFGVGYLETVITYVPKLYPFDGALLIPVAGPWITLATTHWRSFSEETPIFRTFAQGLLVVQGLLQATGLALSIVGVSRYVASAEAAKQRSAHFGFALCPVPGGAGAGMTLRF